MLQKLFLQSAAMYVPEERKAHRLRLFYNTEGPHTGLAV